MLILRGVILTVALCSAANANDPSTDSPFDPNARRDIIEQGPSAQDHHAFRYAKSSRPRLTSPYSPGGSSKLVPSHGNIKSSEKTVARGNQHASNSQYQSYANAPALDRQKSNSHRSNPYAQPPLAAIRQIQPQQTDQFATPYLHNFLGNRANTPHSNVNRETSEGVAQNQATTRSAQLPVYQPIYGVAKGPAYSQQLPEYEATSGFLPTLQSTEKLEQIAPLTGSKELASYLQAFENQPLLLGSRFRQETRPATGFDFGAGSGKQTVAVRDANSPFLSPVSSFQAQIVPIQTAAGSPRFPQYRGASVGVYPSVGNVGRVPGAYEALRAQPQLHFGPGQPVPQLRTGAIQGPKQVGEILTDVEVFPKKRPPPPLPANDDDETGPKTPSFDEDDDREKPRKLSGTDYGDFKPSKSFPFKAYDEQFGKYSNRDSGEDKDEKRSSSYREYDSGEEGDDEKPASDYRSSYESSEVTPGRYEDEDSEESRKHERREKPRTDPDYDLPKRYGQYANDFEQEFERSYRKGLPRNNYVHVKEVPEIEPDRPSKPGKNDRRGKSKPRARYEESNDARSQPTRSPSVPGRVQKPSNGDSNGDSDGYNSNASFEKVPKVVYEEFFKASSPATAERYSNGRKAPKKDSYFRATKSSYKSNSPKTENESAYENGENYSYSSGSDRKSSPEDSYGFSSSLVKELVSPGPVGFYHRARPLTTAEVLRDLTGI